LPGVPIPKRESADKISSSIPAIAQKMFLVLKLLAGPVVLSTLTS